MMPGTIHGPHNAPSQSGASSSKFASPPQYHANTQDPVPNLSFSALGQKTPSPVYYVNTPGPAAIASGSYPIQHQNVNYQFDKRALQFYDYMRFDDNLAPAVSGQAYYGNGVQINDGSQQYQIGDLTVPTPQWNLSGIPCDPRFGGMSAYVALNNGNAAINPRTT